MNQCAWYRRSEVARHRGRAGTWAVLAFIAICFLVASLKAQDIANRGTTGTLGDVTFYATNIIETPPRTYREGGLYVNTYSDMALLRSRPASLVNLAEPSLRSRPLENDTPVLDG